MRIQCLDTQSWIAIHRHGGPAHARYELHCSIDLGHGRFTASNVDLQFLNGDRFLFDLERFVVDPRLTPQLDGTYGSFLIFWRPCGRDDLMLSFSVGDAHGFGPFISEFHLTGLLRLPLGVLEVMIADFRNLLAPAMPS